MICPLTTLTVYFNEHFLGLSLIDFIHVLLFETCASLIVEDIFLSYFSFLPV